MNESNLSSFGFTPFKNFGRGALFALFLLLNLCLRAQGPNEIILYEAANFSGASYTLGIGSYPVLSFPNTISSYKMGANIIAYPHSCYDFGANGVLNAFTAFVPEVLDQDFNLDNDDWDAIVFGPVLGCGGSSNVNDNMKSIIVMGRNCVPGPNEVAIFDGTDYNRGCKLVGIGEYDRMPEASLLNDWASSIKVGSNVQIVVYNGLDFTGSGSIYTANTNVSTLAGTIGNNAMSSFIVRPNLNFGIDSDGDGYINLVDNCPSVSNPNQANNDGDGMGDVCDADDDNDGCLDFNDPLPFIAGTDVDGDGVANFCDPDDDNDGIPDGTDNCYLTPNFDQNNNDNDASGDACDADDDNDGVADVTDNCPLASNASQSNYDGDALGDACDPDDDNDGCLDINDSQPFGNPPPVANCPSNMTVSTNPGQCSAVVYYNVSALDDCPPSVLPGYTFIGILGNNSYFISDNSSSWTDAFQATLANGTHLATIHSQAENDLLSTNLGGSNPWIGLTDKDEEGVFRWVTGEPLTYTNWDPSAPNQNGEEDFGHFFNNTGVWNDFDDAVDGLQKHYAEIENASLTKLSGLYSGELFPLGTSSISYRVTDGLGQTDDCTFTVTVVDNTPPTVTCKNASMNLNTSGSATLLVSQILNTSADNCAVQNLTLSKTTFNCANIGANTVTLTATDAGGNTATCTATVTVSDNIPPTVTCKNATLVLSPLGFNAVSAFLVANSVADNCGFPTTSVAPNLLFCSNVGANTVTLTATDNSGNTATCTATVTVVDNITPTVTCKNATVSLGANGQATLAPAQVTNSASDNCGGSLTTSVAPNAFNCANIGTNVVTLTATDIGGNTQSCTATVTVADNTPPIALCQADFELVLDGLGFATGVGIDGGSSDNCSMASVVVSQQNFDCSHIGDNTVTLTATDESGNTATCSTIITISAGPEFCDNIDNNCNGLIDEGLSNQLYFADTDGDGFGDPNAFISGCTPPTGYVLDNTDCNDNSATVNPAASEICNEIDENCNGQADEGLPIQTYFADNDGDNFGDPFAFTTGCAVPAGFVADDTDCDDNAAAINPGATEICNDIDDDCNGEPDDNLTNQNFFLDNDGDGFGDPNTYVIDCGAPIGFVADGTDCDDNAAAVNPNATEICNLIDDNCDTETDEGFAVQPYFLDSDGDGFGNPNIFTEACTAPSGFVENDDDCNDTNAQISPNATEICNATDDNCDGQTDEGLLNQYFTDNDGDGFGNATATISACTAPSGYVSDNTDCDDTNAQIFPGATETCNLTDDNCNGQIDEGVENQYFADSDGDGFGNATATISACTAPSGYVSDNTDCDDTNAQIFPGATEICGNATDEDCDGQTDEDCAPTCTDNVLTNPGFESGTTGWNFTNCQVLTTTNVYSGQKAVRIGTGSGSGWQTKPASAGQTWTTTFWAKADGSTQNVTRKVELRFVTANYTVLASQTATIPANSSYTQYTLSGTAPAGTVMVKIIFQKSSGGGYIYVDAFCLEGDTPPPPPCGALPNGWTSQDIGDPDLQGSACYDNGTWTVNSAGEDIYEDEDEFHFAHTTLTGNGYIQARVTGITNTGNYALAGVMMRGDLNEESKNVGFFKVAGGGTARQRRSNTGGSTTVNYGSGDVPIWLRITRTGNQFKYFTSSNGTNWTQQGSTVTVTMPATLKVGLAVSSYDEDETNISTFSDVQIGTGNAPLVTNNAGLTFAATKTGESETQLKWISNQVKTGDYFVVERAADGQNFSPILKTDANGNPDEILYFNELDKNPLPGENFYRLKWIQQNGGGERFSEIQKVVFPMDEISVYPNPTSGNVIFISMKNFSEKAADVQLVNAFGQILQTRSFEKLPDAPVQWQLENLPSGTYFFKVKMAGEREITRRFVVQRP